MSKNKDAPLGPFAGGSCLYSEELEVWIAKVYLSSGATMEQSCDSSGAGFTWIFQQARNVAA